MTTGDLPTPAEATPSGDVNPVALARAVAELAELVDRDVIPDELARVLVDGVTAAVGGPGSGLVTDDGGGTFRLRYASPGPVSVVERLQEAMQDGPCTASLASGQPTETDLRRHGDWPEYRRQAVASGVGSVVCLPLLGRGQLWGVLNVYRHENGPLSPHAQAAVQCLARASGAFLSVLDERRTARDVQSQLIHRASHDGLTGLPNRWLFFDLLAHALSGLARVPGGVGVVYVDLDDFKGINDDLGHDVGDGYLRRVAERIRTVLRPHDVVARLGGDEFVLLLDRVDTASEVAAVAERVLGAVAAIAVEPGGTVTSTASIGIAVTDGAGLGPHDLVSQADAAMYRSKRAGGNRYHIYDAVADAAGVRSLPGADHLVEDLEVALDKGELDLYYQPIVALASADAGGARAHPDTVYGVEALLRWHHPSRGTLHAGAFIEAAERSGLMSRLGQWVLSTACRQMVAWDEALGGRAPRQVFVNVSGKELTVPNFADRVAESLQVAGLDADRLTLEITESMAILQPHTVHEALATVGYRGCQLAIDDFGTGYSSLSRLVDIPASILKIDRAFTADLPDDPGTGAMMTAILELGRALGRDLVVEGVEDSRTLETLRDLGCRYVQGYFLGRPVPPEELATALRRPRWS